MYSEQPPRLMATDINHDLAAAKVRKGFDVRLNCTPLTPISEHYSLSVVVNYICKVLAEYVLTGR